MTFLALMVGCMASDADRFRSALPDERLLVDFPSDATARVGEPSTYWRFTQEVSTGVNVLTATVLAGVNIVTTFEPTITNGDTALWGPWTDQGVDGQLTINDLGDGQFTWLLEGRLTGTTPWLALAVGDSTPGEEGDLGVGSFVLDLDAITAVDPDSTATGAFAVTYSGDGETTSVDAFLDDFAENGAAPGDAATSWDQDADGGAMNLVIVADMSVDSLPETILVRSRWIGSGEGRADAWVTGGDLGILALTVSECWDAAAITTWLDDDISLVVEGDPTRCPYADAEYPDAP